MRVISLTEPQPLVRGAFACYECDGWGKRDYVMHGQLFRSCVCESCGGTGEDPRHPRCIGCKKFIRTDADWNQCPDCDTRYPEER